MSDTREKEIMLIGLPGSGKTSFLAALWYMVGQSSRNCALKLDKLDNDSKYLNEIRDAWLRYVAVPRNRFDTAKIVSMLLKDINGRSVRLTFPDMSGESFRMQWSKRQLTTLYDALLRRTSGGMMFVGPNDLKKPHRIDAVDKLVAAIGDAGALMNGTKNVEDAGESNAWDIELAPTQVQLVEMVQIIATRDYFRPKFRLAIIVSAWDEAKLLGISPKQYLEKELPLLDQFLKSNSRNFEVECFGLSAQGARYGQSQASDSKLQKMSPSDRIEAIGSSIADIHDITGPIQWLMR